MELNVQAVRLAMIDKGLNVTTLSKAAGLSSTAINLWLNHGTRPRLDKIGALAKALEMPITAIIK